VRPEVAERFQLASVAPLSYNQKMRLVIPINDLYGRSVGAAFRVLETDDTLPKYINTVFNKSEHLYGLEKAYPSILSNNLGIVVEGYFDVVIAHQEGLTNVVAMCGSSVSYQQALLLRRFTSRVLVVYDGDVNLNQKVVYSFFDRFLNIRMPNKSDPDEYIRTYGTEEFVKYIVEQSHANALQRVQNKLLRLKG
jgi:DNA primase